MPFEGGSILIALQGLFVFVFSSSESIKEGICKLCQVEVHTPQALRLHLHTARHRECEDELSKVAQRGS